MPRSALDPGEYVVEDDSLSSPHHKGADHRLGTDIAAFDDDPTKLITYRACDDGLFRAAVSHRGASSTCRRPGEWQPYYDTIIKAANCSTGKVTLTRLRMVPTDTVHTIFDNDTIMPMRTLASLRHGHFVKAPYLTGGNMDEGTSFAMAGINTTREAWGVANATAQVCYRTVLGYSRDRRSHGATFYSYLFNTTSNGVSPNVGPNHGSEVPYVFYNVQGKGYAAGKEPVANVPERYIELADVMSTMGSLL
ncbi:uncharacterized protein Z518_07374 [Rhinocladiella mackenziei CBS 650.93]|uniref:Rhinocladiella mackenziei CBS 650.93 unplaced genomic scaffold supercont1.5, whole genome shotgun sequence n=1 Tax=Rhinocladiella mackenziei CBS 650.93 TaxID=1442369 RepID=A0A0D2IKU0_9EURO|nr:uncharacterized protein Z518_07374 [Rhinocladiella mackenziei CBS 650.93]KIX03821.1 hypothetical protein Z518_07374 [Rhinocladiella mackenziei CBS 650.93]